MIDHRIYFTQLGLEYESDLSQRPVNGMVEAVCVTRNHRLTGTTIVIDLMQAEVYRFWNEQQARYIGNGIGQAVTLHQLGLCCCIKRIGVELVQCYRPMGYYSTTRITCELWANRLLSRLNCKGNLALFVSLFVSVTNVQHIRQSSRIVTEV